MAANKTIRSRKRKKDAYQRVFKFPQAKGKTITEVGLFVSSSYYLIEIRFQDKTALSFDIEPCVSSFPKLVDWKTGNYKPLKSWRPIHSKTSR